MIEKLLVLEGETSVIAGLEDLKEVLLHFVDDIHTNVCHNSSRFFCVNSYKVKLTDSPFILLLTYNKKNNKVLKKATYYKIWT